MKNAVLVLGPPRSGTSVVSHVLNKLGLDFGSHDRFVDQKVHTHNPIFFELQSLNDLNDELFAHFSKKFTDFDWVPTEADFTNSVISKFESAIEKFINDEFGRSSYIGLKDPRFCFTLPLWDTVLRRLGFHITYVLCKRSGNSTFISNKVENKYSSDINFRIVVQSTLLARYFLREKTHVVVSYERLIDEPESTILRLCDDLELERRNITNALSVIRADLNHQQDEAETSFYEYFNYLVDPDSTPSQALVRYREVFLAATSEKDLAIANLRRTLDSRNGEVGNLNLELKHRQEQIANVSQALETRCEEVGNLRLELGDGQEQILNLTQALDARSEEVGNLRVELGDGQGHISNLTQALDVRSVEVSNLRLELDKLQNYSNGLTQVLGAYQNSTSWKITRPIRAIAQRILKIKRRTADCFVLLSNFRLLLGMALKLRGKGFAYLEAQLGLLQSPDYASRTSQDRGLAPNFLAILIKLGNKLVQIKRWWYGSITRKRATERNLGLIRGETRESSGLVDANIRFHLDKPGGLLNIIDAPFAISGWCVELNAKEAGKVRVRVGKVLHQHHQQSRGDVQQTFSSIGSFPLEVGFASTPSLPIGLHRVWIEVLGPDGYWVPARRFIVLRLPRIRNYFQRRQISYKTWSKRQQKRLKIILPELHVHMDVMIHKPKFLIVIDIRNELTGLDQSLASLRSQIYTQYEICILTNEVERLPMHVKKGATTLSDLPEKLRVMDYMVFMESDQLLDMDALYEFANAINHSPYLDLIYGDEDKTLPSGERCEPFHKPGWSPDYLETFNYIGFPACYRSSIALECLAKGDQYDLTLRFTERTEQIRHIRKILGSSIKRKLNHESWISENQKNISALEGRLARTSRVGHVKSHEKHLGCYDIQIELQRRPSVSVVIPTAGKVASVEGRIIDLITNIADQIKTKSSYKNTEIIVVDNGDLSDEQKVILNKLGCKRVTYGEPVFNISKKLNLGASIAEGELLLLMNDDIEILSSGWIERMVEHFEKPHVGVVGAKLLYPDLTTQHVGVVHNFGNPDHVRRLQSKDEAGYYFSTCGVRNYMAVTGAVMMTRSDLYKKVGGYSEELAISFNDVDFCLKIKEEGYLSIYAPKAELIHMESVSCARSVDTSELDWYHRAWASKIEFDPYYNENYLSIARPTFEPKVNQRLI